MLCADGWPDSGAKSSVRMNLRQQLKRFGRAVVFPSPVEPDALIGVVACPIRDLADMAAALERCCAEDGDGLTIEIGPCESELFEQLEDARSRRARPACASSSNRSRPCLSWRWTRRPIRF